MLVKDGCESEGSETLVSPTTSDHFQRSPLHSTKNSQRYSMLNEASEHPNLTSAAV